MALADEDATRWAVAALGVALLLSSTVSLRASSPDTSLVELVVGGLNSLLIVGVGVGLARSELDTPHIHVAAAWTLAGTIALTAAGAWTIGFYHIAPDTAQAIIGFDLTAGGLAGSLVGAMSARSRQHATDLADERERLSFLNYLIRHNVLNGVQVVRAQTDLLREEVPADVDHRVDVIDTWTTGLGDLVGRIRHFLDASTGDTDLGVVPVDDVLDAEVAKIEGAFDADITTAGGDPTVRADDGLHQVFECLLVDAVERTQVPDPAITVTTEQRGPEVVVQVATPDPVATPDGGEDFEPDPLTDAAGDLGFGRYLVATLVDYYGGTVHVGDADDDVLYTIELPHASP